MVSFMYIKKKIVMENFIYHKVYVRQHCFRHKVAGQASFFWRYSELSWQMRLNERKRCAGNPSECSRTLRKLYRTMGGHLYLSKVMKCH